MTAIDSAFPMAAAPEKDPRQIPVEGTPTATAELCVVHVDD